ncbi:hypothetical protein VTK56DRAFT_7016 [Thermocarpiscus australiensis]
MEHLQQQQQPQEPEQQREQLPSPELRPSPSRSSTSGSSRSRKSTLSLDLSNLPPLSRPTPPSNTLIFTNLQSRDIFHPENLQTIRDLISQTAPIHAFSPLKSFGRIVVSFFDEASAIAVRQIWDGEAVLGERCRVYFGQPTPLAAQQDVHLALPDAGKLFFISPPPSPPHGWEARPEDPPNKMVHAEDLAEALARLKHHESSGGYGGTSSPVSPAESGGGGVGGGGVGGGGVGVGSRQRSRSSTLIFQPQPELGASPDLPCVTVDDMTDEPAEISPIVPPPRPVMAHTARPPVELMMHDA